MKTTSQKPTCKCSTNRHKTGFLQTENLLKFLRINHTEQPTLDLPPYTYQGEETRRAQELEAELKRDLARAYAGVAPIR